MSQYGDDHDGHVCERCDREYLLRDDAEPTRWCDECAQAIAADITERLAAVEAEPRTFRVLRPTEVPQFSLGGWCYAFRDHFELHWDDGKHEMWRAELSTDGTRKDETAKRGRDE